MHLFEFLLRDFIGTEAQTAPGAVIAMHDCVPRNFIMTDRDWDKSKTKAWSGDVWKLLPILAEYRPELEITVWDCPPTGLVTVTGLDPANRVLSEAYDEIWEKYQAMSLKDFGIETLLTRFPMNSSLDHPAGKAG